MCCETASVCNCKVQAHESARLLSVSNKEARVGVYCSRYN